MNKIMSVNGATLRDSLISAANMVSENRSQLNEINVFPVPDGDTGANLSVTLGAAKRQLGELGDGCTVGAVAQCAAAATLRGSRGNSGAILALLFRGFAKGLSGKREASAAELLLAFKLGAETAFRGVQSPAEGTILTVARETVRQGEAFLSKRPDADISELWSYLAASAKRVLDDTPRLLPVLREAGVVDAGGQGLYCMLQGMAYTFSGNGVLPDSLKSQGPLGAYVFMEQNVTGVRAGASIVTYRVMFDLQQNGNTEIEGNLRIQLEALGKNVVVVKSGETIRCQVFTERPDRALIAGMRAGKLMLFTGKASATPGKVRFSAPVEEFRFKKNVEERKEHGGWLGEPPYSYCMELTVLKDIADCSPAEQLTAALERMGDGVAVAEGEDLIQCHVHTNVPEELLGWQIKDGYVTDIRIENMCRQMENQRA